MADPRPLRAEVLLTAALTRRRRGSSVWSLSCWEESHGSQAGGVSQGGKERSKMWEGNSSGLGALLRSGFPIVLCLECCVVLG